MADAPAVGRVVGASRQHPLFADRPPDVAAGRHGQNGVSEAAYKGPCPPWNDERFHHYHVTVYALDVDRLELPDPFDRADLLKAAKGHILASGSATLRYATNAKARE